VKTPFYMTYPIQNLYQAEIEYEKDMERMKELYPAEVRKILVCVEDRCDELEFEGSRIYDENPDRRMMWQEIMKLYHKLQEEGMPDEPIENPTEKPIGNPMEKPMDRSMPADRSFALHLPDGWAMPEEETAGNEALGAMQMPPEGGRGPAPCGPDGPCNPGGPQGPGGTMPPPPPQPCNSWLCNTVGVLFGNEVYRRRCRYRRCHRWW
jgi:hypothetical protein